MGLLVIANGLSAARAEAFGYGQSGSYGDYSTGSYGGYAADSSLAAVPAHAGSLSVSEQIAGQQRSLLAVSEITVPANIPAASTDRSSSSSKHMGMDIIPAEVPATQAWDAQTWKSWEQWYDHNVNSGAATPGDEYSIGGAYGHTISGNYGSYAAGAYGGYGTEGAYFDFRSGRSFNPEQAAAQQSESVPPAVELPASADAGERLSSMQQQQEQLHMSPVKPTLGGVSRGRGLPLSHVPEKGNAASAGAFTGLYNLASLNLPKLQRVAGIGSTGRKLLNLAYDELFDTAHQLRDYDSQGKAVPLLPPLFSRKLHLGRSSSSESAGHISLDATGSQIAQIAQQ